MIQNTFRHIPGIGAKREIGLWKKGITTWDLYEKYFDRQLNLFGKTDATFGLSRSKLNDKDADYFALHFPVSEYFRIALDFPEETMFLDIETTGTGFKYDQITVVGWSVGNDFKFYIANEDPQSMIEDIKRAKAIVTFNGSSFDIPIIQKAFPEIQFPKSHIDLKFLSRRIGLRGGQKRIEKEIGMHRHEEIANLTGQFAPFLWEKYKSGDKNSLNTLIHYNYADVYGMKWILDYLLGKILNDYNLTVNRYLFAHDKGNIPDRFKK